MNAQVKISTRDCNWNTPLHLAVKFGRVEAVKYLMQVTDEQQEDDIDGVLHKFLKAHSYLDEAILSHQLYIIMCMDTVRINFLCN